MKKLQIVSMYKHNIVYKNVKKKLVLRLINKKQNEELKPEEFIGLCVDSSECKYEFEDATAAATLTSTVGNDVKVSIIVKDETDNETKVEGILNVIESGIRAYYECTSKEQNLEDLNATMTLTHSLGILDTNAADGKLAFGGFGTQKFVYKFTDAEQFDKLQKEFKENGTVKINNVEGIASFDKEKLTITMISDLDLANLKTQYGEESFVSYGTLKPLYENTLGYTCKQNRRLLNTIFLFDFNVHILYNIIHSRGGI